MPEMFEVHVDSREVMKALEGFDIGSRRGLEQGLYALGMDIFGDSQLVVPRDTGTLAASGGIEGPYTNNRGDPEVLIYYGGPAAEYALIVHEDLEAYHDEPTSAKYLEGPFIARIKNVPTTVGIEIAKAMAEEARR